MKRSDFLNEYRKQLIATYAWAREKPGQLDAFMEGVVHTLDGKRQWIAQGEAVTNAWNNIGGRGKPTLKELRALT